MLIRPANLDDCAAISAVAESVRYQAASADAHRGYLVYVGKPEEYAARLTAGADAVVAEEDGQLLGFLICTAAGMPSATHNAHADVQERMFGEGTYLVDQIGVSPAARGRGIAQSLYDAMVAHLKPERLTASIMHYPMRNARSIGFFAGKNGWKCIGEYAEGDGFLWGLYEWKADEKAGDVRYPIGQFLYTGVATEADMAGRIARIGSLPGVMRAAVEQWSDDQLDRPLREGAWTVRQVLHHVADAAIVFVERIRLTLTETDPAVKTFEEGEWVKLADAQTAPAGESLAILDGLQARLERLLQSRPHSDFERCFLHPDQGLVKLDRLLAYLDWHGRHHAAQIFGHIPS